MSLTRRNANKATPTSDAEDRSLDGIDVDWDDKEEPGRATVQPPARPGSETVRPPEAAIAEGRDFVDDAAALRSARTAAAMGRVRVAAATAKITAFDLSHALARLTQTDDD